MPDVRNVFLSQAEACRMLGSPFTARLCETIAENLMSEGLVWEHIRNWPSEDGGYKDALPLRVTGAFHAIVRLGLSEKLAALYPPSNPHPDPTALLDAVQLVADEQSDFILGRLKRAPQTNEVRRAGILLAGFLEIARRTGQEKLILSELGASAGLNMCWDQFSYKLGDFSWGRDDATPRLEIAWEGAPPISTELRVINRAGCDLFPVDLGKIDTREALLAYIWPDQPERMMRTEQAIEVAIEHAGIVRECDAADWLEERLSPSHTGAVHVVYHTVVWQYFSEDTKRRATACIEQAGQAATSDSPLAWLRFEEDGLTPGGGVELTLWPGGESVKLGRADYHGRWIQWQRSD